MGESSGQHRDAVAAFHRDMLAIIARMKREIPYNPTRFTQMVARDGAVEAAQALLRGRDVSEGFSTLWASGHLDWSVEAFVLLPWYESLFSVGERQEARRRLERHDFDVDAFLASTTGARPSSAPG